jgi:hypothetical protein
MANGAIDVSAFASALGVVVKKDRNDIIQGVFTVDDPIIKACRTSVNVQPGNIYKRNTGEISEVAQGWYGSKYTHKGDITLTPSSILQFGHKINVTMYPADLMGSWIAEDGVWWDESKELQYGPFVRWALKNMVLAKLKDDHIYKQLYSGIYVDYTSDNDVSHDADEAMNGLKYILQNGDYHGLHFANQIACDLSSSDAETIYENVNAAVKEIDEKFRFTVPMNMFMSLDKVQLYWEGREIVTGARVRTDDSNRNIIPNTNIQLIGSPSMTGTEDMFVTRKGNLVRIIDKTGIDGQMMTQVADYAVKLLSNPYGLAYGFDYLEEVWTNVEVSSGS